MLDWITPGATVYIPGAAAETRWLQHRLTENADRLAGVTLTSCLLPGINGFDYSALHPASKLVTFLLSPALHDGLAAGRVALKPLTYTGIARYIANQPIDIAFLHLAPGPGGQASFGDCADFGPIAAANAKRRVGLLNTALASVPNSPSIALADLDAVIEISETPEFVEDAAASPEATRIAQYVASLIEDGSSIQTGIGATPTAVWAALTNHRQLVLRSGLVTNGFVAALESGAMAQSGHLCGFAWGGEELRCHVARSDIIAFADARTTHGDALHHLERFVAVNGALEIDLFGQVNLEWLGARLVSGAGGAPDFVSAALKSTAGTSVIALPATARNGSVSRILPKLEWPASLSRAQADVFVTEYGIARCRHLSIDARAEALIEIAAPQHRSSLEAAWRELRLQL